MTTPRNLLASLVGLLAVLAPGLGVAAEAISFVASDRVRVFAEYYPAEREAAPLILLFHQAGSNRAEYATIAPVLVRLGFAALAVDQRSGGAAWGRPNETVQLLGHSAGFDEALPDLEAALQWAKASSHGGKPIVWGSSYSAALVFLLAAKHQGDIAAVLAFSPGEFIGASGTIRRAAAQLSLPIFVTSAKDSGEIAAAKALIDAAPAGVKSQFIPRVAGIHGSATLRIDRNAKGAEENWDAVKSFLMSLGA